MISFLLNLPFTIIGLFISIISIPISFKFHKNPYSFIFIIRSFWWTFSYFKHARALTIGHVILLGPKEEKNDLEHELIHVKQWEKEPLIYPVLYYLELLNSGYLKNKYEEKAYSKSGSVYRKS